MSNQTVFACLSFHDAKSSFDWLERVLGAERVAVYEDDEGRVAHAEIRVGSSVIMGGDERAGAETATPAGTSVLYVVVPDADAAHERAADAGAGPGAIEERDYDSREFTVVDPDGNRWICGTYRGEAAG